MTDIMDWLCRLMVLARKVNSGKATEDEALEYDYDLMLLVCGVCIVGIAACIAACIVMSYVQKILQS